MMTMKMLSPTFRSHLVLLLLLLLISHHLSSSSATSSESQSSSSPSSPSSSSSSLRLFPIFARSAKVDSSLSSSSSLSSPSSPSSKSSPRPSSSPPAHSPPPKIRRTILIRAEVLGSVQIHSRKSRFRKMRTCMTKKRKCRSRIRSLGEGVGNPFDAHIQASLLALLSIARSKSMQVQTM